MQDCSNSIAIALELLQSCTKPSISDSRPHKDVKAPHPILCWHHISSGPSWGLHAIHASLIQAISWLQTYKLCACKTNTAWNVTMKSQNGTKIGFPVSKEKEKLVLHHFCIKYNQTRLRTEQMPFLSTGPLQINCSKYIYIYIYHFPTRKCICKYHLQIVSCFAEDLMGNIFLVTV